MKKYRFAITYLTVFFLILNIGLVSATPIFDGKGIASKLKTEDSSDRILLCTSQGWVWVTITNNNILEEPTQTHISTHHCPFCLSNSVDFDDIFQAHTDNYSYDLAQSLSSHPPLNTPFLEKNTSPLKARAPPILT